MSNSKLPVPGTKERLYIDAVEDFKNNGDLYELKTSLTTAFFRYTQIYQKEQLPDDLESIAYAFWLLYGFVQTIDEDLSDEHKDPMEFFLRARQNYNDGKGCEADNIDAV